MITMKLSIKRNTSYIIMAFIALIEIGVIWWAADYNRPPAMVITTFAIMAGIIIAYLVREMANKTEPGVVDERVELVNSKSALKTLQIFWILSFSILLGSIVRFIDFNRDIRREIFGPIFGQLIMLVGIIFLFVAFRVYYNSKYGGYDTDEESD